MIAQPRAVRESPVAAPAPVVRISAFYFWYFGILGVMVPYWTPYLAHRGFTAVQIGLLSAVSLVARIAAPYVWGALADRRGASMPLVRTAAVLTPLIFTAVLWPGDFLWMAVVMSLYGFFWNACLPQFEANTLRHLGTASARYGRLRLWGSVGFILTTLAGGVLLERFGLAPLPFMLLAAMVATALCGLIVPEASHHRVGGGSAASDARRGPLAVGAFLLVCHLMQASHGPFYTFFSIYLDDVGYSRTVTGWYWSAGVVAEIAVFLWLGRALPRLGAVRLLRWSLLIAAARWVVTGFWVDNPLLLLLAQLGHGATFGAFHASAMVLIHALFTDSARGRGQALYSSVGFGAGGALGGLYSGYLWDSAGPGFTFGVAVLLALLAWGLCAGLVAEPAVRT